MRSVWICVVFALALMINFRAAAQSGNEGSTRSVQGKVTGVSGQPMPDAAVLLKDAKSLQIRSFRTGSDGNYHFAGLSSNIEYQLRADHDGATSGWKTLSVFNTKKVATIDLKIKK